MATYDEYFYYVHHNYAFMSKQTGNGLCHMLVGIYSDGAATNWHCYENVITEQSYGVAPSEENHLYSASDPSALWKNDY